MSEPAEDLRDAVEGVDDPVATITAYRDGPLIVRGDFRITAADGTPIDPGRRTVALCRCGRSALKPFCDGSHKATGFAASGGDERPPAAARRARDERECAAVRTLPSE